VSAYSDPPASQAADKSSDYIQSRIRGPGGCEVRIGAALHDGPVLVDDGDLQAGEPQAGLDRDRWTWDTVQRAAMVSPG
jgi:hypothetical protein